MRTSAALLSILLAVLTGCGDRTPESAASKEVGAAPKQAMDKVVNEANRAVQKGAERMRDADQDN